MLVLSFKVGVKAIEDEREIIEDSIPVVNKHLQCIQSH